MAWITLILAGFCEVGLVIFLKLSDGFKRLWPSLGFILFGGLSFYLLSLSLVDLPIGTAYAIWTGIGSAGSVVVGMLFFKEPKDIKRILLILCIITGVVGLKLTA
ncbi:DMT family transporter [Metabacillus iocasae]|uniref:Quaternary ammonium compound-resistance protein SugE n=1 Tax=Priestia iocasae TaxID=2291674 RepID=A0ABS2QUL0_9BACI|nr:multidrug efflux SMR transporter [Metabacillus iocasae]MBM7702406.1 quaternary ammonium compound-resistance protein SugE [Metabacillus iocasae]